MNRDTFQETASKNLGKNLHKVVKVALLNYNKQTLFYRNCNSVNAHVSRFVAHFYQGFLAEAKYAAQSVSVFTPSLLWKKPMVFGTESRGVAVFQ